MNGATLSFSETDLLASAAAYDPALHEAPIVVGHPKADGPAYGWIKALSFAGNTLEADPIQVNPDFAELVASGAFKKISASFYSPDSPSNPVPGVFYLRHVGFLGAQPPAVKGMRNPSFADNEQGIVDFNEYDDVQNASLWRNLREFFITKFGLEAADQTIPNDAVQLLEQSAQDELREEADDQAATDLSPSYQELNPGDIMSVEDKARLAALEEENRLLKEREASFAEAEKTRKTESAHASHLAFAEGLVKAGQLSIPQKNVVAAVLDFMAGHDDVIEFGEGDAKQPLIDVFKTDLLAKLPKLIEFGEIGAAAGDAHTVDFASPDGLPVDTAALKTHNDALAYQLAHKTDYQAALHAVSNR